jgi:hypothetical protein
MTYGRRTRAVENTHRSTSSVYKCGLPVKNLIALQHNLDAILEEIS